jgi:HAD superfamily hydrolase (TIGR01490 family)
LVVIYHVVGEDGMQAAVFSDVEGTLIDGSIPLLALRSGLSDGLFSPSQRVQIALWGGLAERGPARLTRTFRLIALLRATAGMTDQQVERWLRVLIPELHARVKSDILERLREHQTRGLGLVLVSGGLHEAIARFGIELGGHGEGTKLRRREGRYLGRLDGSVCQGEAKAARARAVLSEHGYDAAQCYGYGDTASDIPFLALFGHACAVDPDAGLEAEARRRGWSIIRTMEAPNSA